MRWFPSAAAAAFALLPEEAAADLSCDRGGAARGEVDGPGMAEAEAERIGVDLMQARMQLLKVQPDGHGDVFPMGLLRSEAGSNLSAEQRAEMLLPVAWFHVSKTGSSMYNTLYHTPAICPGFSADNYISDSEEMDGKWDPSWGRFSDICPGFSSSYREGVMGGPHAGLGGLTGRLFELNRGHLVTLLRQPEQRVISQYYHSGPLPLMDDRGGEPFWPYVASERSEVGLREYATWNGGCVVRQLVSSATTPCQSRPVTATPTDVTVAVKMLQDGFAFVGITEQWDLSVCLFRAMFGGQCIGSDFYNTRPTANGSDYDTSGLHGSSYYDTSGLHGWVDTVDAPVYAEGLRLFELTRKVYGVDSDQCAQFCQGALF